MFPRIGKHSPLNFREKGISHDHSPAGAANCASFCLYFPPCCSRRSSYAQGLDYPQTRKDTQVDDYHGTKVADPYRWLEDDNSAETAKWVEAENKVHVSRISTRFHIAPK